MYSLRLAPPGLPLTMKKPQTPFETMATLLAEWLSANPTPSDYQSLALHDRARKKLLRSHGWSGRTNRTCFYTEKSKRDEAERQRKFEAWALPQAQAAGFATVEDYTNHLILNVIKDLT